MFGTGISPGFAELLAIVSATICDRVDKVTVNEAADTTFYDSPATEIPVGFGKPIDHPDLQAMTAHGTAVFGEAVRMVADALGVELDDVRCEAEYAQTTADLDLGSWTIAAGCVAGVAASWKGSVGDKVLVELNVRWRKGQTLEPDWKIDQDGWVIQIDGRPTVTANDRLPPAARLRGRDDRRLHGARAHHDRGAAAQRDPGRRRRGARHRDLQRSAAGAAARDRVVGIDALLEEVGLLARDHVPERLERARSTRSASRPAAYVLRAMSASISTGVPAASASSCAWQRALHRDERPHRRVDGVADGEQPVVAEDDRLGVAERGSDALALLEVEHDAGEVVEQGVVLEERARVLRDRVEEAARATTTPCRTASASARPRSRRGAPRAPASGSRTRRGSPSRRPRPPRRCGRRRSGRRRGCA